MTKIHVIGIGYKPLDKQAREIILNSEVIFASSRLFEVFERYEEFEKVKDKIKVINNVNETINFIKSLISSRLTHYVLSSSSPLETLCSLELVEDSSMNLGRML